LAEAINIALSRHQDCVRFAFSHTRMRPFASYLQQYVLLWYANAKIPTYFKSTHVRD
jgi:hypothetical protein